MASNLIVTKTPEFTDNAIIITTTTSIGVFIFGLIGFTFVVIIVCTCARYHKQSGYTYNINCIHICYISCIVSAEWITVVLKFVKWNVLFFHVSIEQIPLQINPVYVETTTVRISDRSNNRVLLNKNEAYQECYIDNPVYETII